ncbi:hypothetical protein [Nocardia sp. NPDC127526]|uniref:hypothetical protein n=1 Tax=Nocardia sp. NPDC127526 TaxID=3345393 RepID=UPI003628425E
MPVRAAWRTRSCSADPSRGSDLVISRTANWRARAWTLQAVAYVLTFGAPTVVALIVLLTRQPPQWPAVAGTAYAWAGRASFVIAALALWAAYRWLGLNAAELGLRAKRSPAVGFLGGMGVAYLALWLGMLAMYAFPEWVAVPSSHGSAADAIEWAVRAGVVEELMLLALPMAIMTRLRLPWWIQLTALMILRLPFHLYYGPAALALVLVWCTIAWFAYSRIKLIWPFVLAHALYNLDATVIPFGIGRVAIGLTMLALGIAALISLFRSTDRITCTMNKR